MQLARHLVEKPWGRVDLPPEFGDTHGARIGEIWFAPNGPLLIKYIFTGERLSVQVHPSDAEARARGLPHGKNECWYIVDADPGATIGMGVRTGVSSEALRAAALDGSIVDLLEWRTVARGDFLYVPAGTVHAIGAGITLIEVQQPADITYRLFDYGRPRDLHLDDGIAVARREPFPDAQHRRGGEGDALLIESPAFTVRRTGAAIDMAGPRDRWVVPLAGHARSGRDCAVPGNCLFVAAGEVLVLDQGCSALVATV